MNFCNELEIRVDHNGSWNSWVNLKTTKDQRQFCLRNEKLKNCWIPDSCYRYINFMLTQPQKIADQSSCQSNRTSRWWGESCLNSAGVNAFLLFVIGLKMSNEKTAFVKTTFRSIYNLLFGFIWLSRVYLIPSVVTRLVIMQTDDKLIVIRRLDNVKASLVVNIPVCSDDTTDTVQSVETSLKSSFVPKQQAVLRYLFNPNTLC